MGFYLLRFVHPNYSLTLWLACVKIILRLCSHIASHIFKRYMKFLNSFEKSKLKEIRYNGGVINFYIPQNWKVDVGENGGCFYEDSPQSSTLRLNLITMETLYPVTDQDAEKVILTLKTLNNYLHKVEKLSNGCALITYSITAKEESYDLLIQFWIVVNVVPPNHARIATFSYTILKDQMEDKKTIYEIELLDREIRKATFAEELGL
jgi:hypothetical protein